MFKKELQYMMSNDPNETLSEKGDKIRRKIRPYFYNVLKLGNKLKLITDKKEIIKTDRPIIYVASHGFKDDVLNTVITVKDNAYIVFGNIDLFYNTLDGFCLWVYGAQLVDRYNPESKHAMKNKMDRVIKLGNNLIIFAEATWNLTPEKPMLKLHGGFYDVAIKNNALVVPVLTHKVGKKCYSRMLPAIDLSVLSEEDIETIKISLNKYINKAIDTLAYNTLISKKIKNSLLELKQIIISNNLNIDEIEQNAHNIFLGLQDIILYKDIPDDIKLTIKEVSKIISRISMIRKEVMVSKVRDVMALEKYDMFEKYPDYSYMKNGKNMYEAWNDYINDTITATKYFYLEPESTTVYKDSLIKDEIEVMPWLENKTYKKK